VHIISKRTRREYWEEHSDLRDQLDSWFRFASKADWKSLVDVRATYPHADMVGAFTVYSIKGDDCRLIVKLEFEKRLIFIRRVYTHAEDNKDRWAQECNC
jgi:mRNA interferase HigB